MKNESVWNAFEQYSNNVILSAHNNLPLFQRWLRRLRDMETQVLCDSRGEPVPDSNKFTDGNQVWGPIRWPYRASTEEASYSDPPITFLISEHMVAIGSTGWDWKNKKSRWLGFDFDAIAGHAEGVGVSDEVLAQVESRAPDWVEIIRSTRGNGRHLYLLFDEDDCPTTNTHTEHAALARAFLPILSASSGLDLSTSVDVCGSVLWIHHRNATPANRGYAVVREASRHLTNADCPPNWRDHLEVISGGRNKVRVRGFDGDASVSGDALDKMTESHVLVKLDETHHFILDALQDSGFTCLWVGDHNLAQTHTGALKCVYERLASAGKPLKGLFDTNSPGGDPGKPNCLAADTRVITREGVKTIGSLTNKTVSVITTRGEWVTVPFKSYGTQEVFAVTLAKANQTKVIKATGDHRWFVCANRSNGHRKTKVNMGDRKEVFTKDLEEGQILVQTKPQNQNTPSVVGIQHGLVWGDGTNSGNRVNSALSLFSGKDDELLKYFVGHPQRTLTNSVGGVEVWNLPRHFKSLVPLQFDKPYLYGWLAGYFAADGCVSKQGACILRSHNKESIEHVRNVCHILGIETSKVTSTWKANGYKPAMVYTVVLKASDLSEEFFLLRSHRERFNKTTNRQHQYWRVASVEPAGKEEVFCCTVPETGCFCLEDFILIGNCFMRPKLNGAWDVYRFGQGTNEHPLWDKQGPWTHTTFNHPPTLKQIAAMAGGYESTEKNQGFLFNDAASIMAAMDMLGSKRVLPPRAQTGRLFSLRVRQDGKLVLNVNKEKSDNFSDFPGWTKAGKGWEILVNEVEKCTDQEKEEADTWAELDEKIRMLKCVSYEDLGSMSGAFDGWVLKDGTDKWVRHPRENVASYLQALGYDAKNVSMTLGKAIERSWTVVNEPFQPEFPGGRVWNLGASQHVYAPVDLAEGERPHHPHWDKVMNHCGQDLNEYIPKLDWCKEWGIKVGGDYMKAWVACLLRYPFLKLPYLFMYGPQNSGKSMFHEAIALLVTRGVVKADRALTSSSGYNGELLNAILGVIDEVDISKAGASVYNKLKEWTTGLTLSVHAKYKQVYEARSSLHFVQMSNSRSSCPVMSGDTRITAVNVPPLIEEIPKETLVEALKSEGPAFMRTIMDWNIPEALGRLRLPVIETKSKESVMATNRNPLEAFIEDRCFAIPGATVLFSDFVDAFHERLDVIECSEWKKSNVRTALIDLGFPVGRRSGNQDYVGNLTLNSDDLAAVELVMASGGRLLRKGNDND